MVDVKKCARHFYVHPLYMRPLVIQHVCSNQEQTLQNEHKMKRILPVLIWMLSGEPADRVFRVSHGRFPVTHCWRLQFLQRNAEEVTNRSCSPSRLSLPLNDGQTLLCQHENAPLLINPLLLLLLLLLQCFVSVSVLKCCFRFPLCCCLDFTVSEVMKMVRQGLCWLSLHC